MVRPHPGFWRVVHGVVILYLLALVFLLFQNVDDARQLLKVWPGVYQLCKGKLNCSCSMGRELPGQWHTSSDQMHDCSCTWVERCCTSAAVTHAALVV